MGDPFAFDVSGKTGRIDDMFGVFGGAEDFAEELGDELTLYRGILVKLDEP